MQNGYDLYPSKSNFKYFIRLQSTRSYQGKLQKNYAVLTFCDFKHRVIVFTVTDYIKPCLKSANYGQSRILMMSVISGHVHSIL